MKKLLCLIIINLISFSNICFWEEQNGIKKFIVTAYYSPLPNQNFYLRWSYEGDVLLNWEWTHWASGKAVYPGMLAAPKNYKFWTKIYLDWFGIWTVDDRWGAIVWSWNRWYNYDRLDIWMWYGEEGLKRALTWWKREVTWRIIGNEVEDLPSLSLDTFKVWFIDSNTLKNNSVWKNIVSEDKKQVLTNNIIPKSINKNSSETEIKKLQQILVNIWYFKWKIDWKYSKDLINTLINFQLDNKLIKKSTEYGAWYYGPKTRVALEKKYSLYLKEEEKNKQEQIKKEQKLAKTKEQVKNLVAEFWNPKLNETWVHVRKLQQALKMLGYFDSKDTAIFWQKTQDSLTNYQIEKWIIKDKNEKQAWIIGPNTTKFLQEDLFKIITERNKSLMSFKN